MPWVYAGSVSPERRYQLQNLEANRKIDALLEHLRVPGETWRYESELVTTALKLFEDGAQIADLKIASAALKELRYGFKVFAPYRSVPKVTVFGSARMPADHPVSEQARSFVLADLIESRGARRHGRISPDHEPESVRERAQHDIAR